MGSVAPSLFFLLHLFATGHFCTWRRGRRSAGEDGEGAWVEMLLCVPSSFEGEGASHSSPERAERAGKNPVQQGNFCILEACYQTWCAVAFIPITAGSNHAAGPLKNQKSVAQSLCIKTYKT